VAIDRAATLRNAEKLLRQGKLDLAITEYLRVIDEFPRDWNTGNILGDLFVRAGQADKAVDQFIRIADSLSDEGFLPKAHAIYKKVLKIKPDHEHALLQGAEIAGSQGLIVDARAYLNTLLERRRSKGDQRGVAQMRIRLAMLDPADYAARFTAARARIDVSDAAGALRDFKELAVELTEKGRQAEAVEALREAAALSPDDEDVRERLLHVHLASGDFVKARECASTSDQFKAIAAQLESMGQPDEALTCLREAARLDPSDFQLQENLARAFVARGDLAAAAEYLTVESAGNDPRLLLMVAEIRFRGDRIEEGLEVVRKILAGDPMRRQDVAMIGWTVAEQNPDAGFRVVELAADTAVAQQDWPSAAAALQEFVTRVPSHIPALMRLVEICVDGGLEATMYSAQAQLADAYITAGSAAEARFIAEDLVAREPWERSNIERFRRALVLMGEPDPDGIIADRLSGQSPFMSTDLSLQGDELPPFELTMEPPPKRAAEKPTAPPSPTKEAPVQPVASDGGAPPVAVASTPTPPADLASKTLDLKHILGDLDTAPTAHSRSDSVEVDLSIVLDDIKKTPKSGSVSNAPDAPAAEAPPSVPAPPRDLDGVFSRMRDESAKRSPLGAAEDEFKRGVALLKAGQADEAISLLQSASKSPRLRFATASIVGRLFKDRGMLPQAVEWLERAAEAPAPTADEGHELLYELAQALEDTGETARALAICIELQAEAGDYKDVAARVDRLAKVQTRG
jgi:tetratricopeptide (TPR) repeat protein